MNERKTELKISLPNESQFLFVQRKIHCKVGHEIIQNTWLKGWFSYGRKKLSDARQNEMEKNCFPADKVDDSCPLFSPFVFFYRREIKISRNVRKTVVVVSRFVSVERVWRQSHQATRAPYSNGICTRGKLQLSQSAQSVNDHGPALSTLSLLFLLRSHRLCTTEFSSLKCCSSFSG